MVTEIDAGESADERLRRQWGESLSEHLDAQHLTRKDFQRRLADEGCEVSLQAISLWCTGQTSPTAARQAVIAKVLSAPAKSIFPVVAA